MGNSLRALSWRLGHALWLGVVLSAPPLPPHARRLNGPLPRTSLGDVKDFWFVPGSERVLYLADQDQDEVFELYSRSLDPLGPSVRLNTPLHPEYQYDVDPTVQIDPTGTYAVYRYAFYICNVRVDGSQPENTNGFFGTFSPDGQRLVYAAPSYAPAGLRSTTENNGNNVSLTGPEDHTQEMFEFEITPDSQSVVFRSDLTVNDRYEVFRAPIDGSVPAVSLSGSAFAHDNVTSFRTSANGQWAVMRVKPDQIVRYELFRVPVDASQAPVRITPALTNGQAIDEGYRITPDGTRVVYTAMLDSAAHDLYCVPLLGPASATKLNSPLAAGGTIAGDFLISADSSRVVYRADPDGDGVLALFGARLDGATPPIELVTLAPGETLGRFALTPDSQRVVFLRAGACQTLESVSIDGSAAPVTLHPPLVAGGDVVSFELAGNRVVYRADQDEDEVLELFSAPADASAPAVRLHPPLAPGRAVLPGFKISPDGQWVGFVSDRFEDERFELFRAPVDGSAPARRASDPAAGAPVPVGSVGDFLPAGERVVYGADQEQNDVFGVFSVPLDGSQEPARLNALPVAGGDVRDFLVTSDHERVVYLGDLQTDEVMELYSAPVDGTAAPARLNGPLVAGGNVQQLGLSADGDWAVYTADELRDEQIELFASRTDSSAPRVRLHAAPRPDFGDVYHWVIAPDSHHVVFAFDETRRAQVELFVAPIDGSAPASKLNGTLVTGGDVTTELVSSDSQRVVYTADQDVDGMFELYSARMDGSTPPVKLNPPLGTALDVTDAKLAAGSRVVFTARELYSVPIDGSAPATALFPSPAPTVKGVWVTPLGTRAVVLAETGPVHKHALFSVPTDGSTPPVPLGVTFPSVPFVQLLFPDEGHAIFTGQFTSGTFRVPLDGSSPAVLLDARGPLALSADGSLVLLAGGVDPGVFVVPTDGSAAPRRLGRALPLGGWVGTAKFAHGGIVLYSATEERAGVMELFASGLPFAPRHGASPGTPVPQVR